jgi:Fe-S cluster assembly protein SufD
MARRLTPPELLDDLSLPVSERFSAALGDRVRAALEGREVNEFWKYTPIQDFMAGLREVTITQPILSGIDQPGVQLTRMSEEEHALPLGPADQPSASRFPLADIALLMSGDLLVLRVSGEVSEPIGLEFGDGLHVPLLLKIESGARVSVTEQASSTHFSNHSVYLDIGPGASVEHASAALTSSVSHWSLTQVRQARDSSYNRQQYHSGGSRRRSETQILLSEPGASAEVTGAFVVDEGTHLDQQLVLEHRAPRTTSRQKFHGIGAGKGTAVFNGRIHIHPDAPGSDAELSNRNLALHPEAIINTKPELEIYTDDVKCAHGATIGQISEDSLFYLRSRGLAPDQSRRMLCREFIKECIEGALATTAEDALLGSWTAP